MLFQVSKKQSLLLRPHTTYDAGLTNPITGSGSDDWKMEYNHKQWPISTETSGLSKVDFREIMKLKYKDSIAEEDHFAIYQRQQWQAWLNPELVSLPNALQCIRTTKVGFPTSENLDHLQVTTLLTKYVHHDIADLKVHMNNVNTTVHTSLDIYANKNKTILNTLSSTQASPDARITSLEVKVGQIDDKLDAILAL